LFLLGLKIILDKAFFYDISHFLTIHNEYTVYQLLPKKATNITKQIVKFNQIKRLLIRQLLNIIWS